MVTILAAVGNLFSFQLHPIAKEKTPPLFRKWGFARRQPIRFPGKLVIRFRIYIPFPSFSLRPLRQNIKPLLFEARITGEGSFDSEIPHPPGRFWGRCSFSSLLTLSTERQNAFQLFSEADSVPVFKPALRFSFFPFSSLLICSPY
jgi:hypothetical protein